MRKSEKNLYWSPYAAGALSGLVLVLSVWFTDNYIGASTSFVRSAGMIERIFSPSHVEENPYFMKNVPKIEWQWMFVGGIFIGSLAAAKLSGTFRLQAVPLMWRERFGGSIGKRGIAAFIGGIVAMFGARLADG
jgi:uncharacterized protein